MWGLRMRSQCVNRKRKRRLWRGQQFQVRRVMRPRRRERRVHLTAAFPGHIWAYDYLEDPLADDRCLHILTVMDEFTREGLALEVWPTTAAEHVLKVLGTLIVPHGAPHDLRSDNGPAFVAQALHPWLATCQVVTLYLRPGTRWVKPWQHGTEERFNGTVRDECIPMQLTHSLAEARICLGAVLQHSISARPPAAPDGGASLEPDISGGAARGNPEHSPSSAPVS